MPGYEDFTDRLILYIESIQAAPYPFEIIIVEDQCIKNVALVNLDTEWLLQRNARIIPYQATYPNPYNYNIIEAFSKNVGIYLAKYPYICVTNCDIIFDPSFFKLTPSLSTFYRFLMYEIKKPSTLKEALESPATLINPQIVSHPSLKNVAYKSGDIMLMDAVSWRNIKGYPENEMWVHSDLIVCTVVNNNKIDLNVPKDVRILTMEQTRTTTQNRVALNMAASYLHSTTCN
jgi:hypothetical protein